MFVLFIKNEQTHGIDENLSGRHEWKRTVLMGVGAIRDDDHKQNLRTTSTKMFSGHKRLHVIHISFTLRVSV